MTSMDFQALYHVAAGQHGLFTRAQALRAGASAYQIKARIERGEWVVVLAGVLAIAGLPVTQRVREAAALLELPGTVLGGPSAARRYGLVEEVARIFVVGAVFRRSPKGVTILRERVSTNDVVWRDGWTLTTPARTVLDCMRLLADDPARTLLKRALDRRLVTHEQMAQRIRDRKGRPGTPRLLGLLRSSDYPATCDASRSRRGSTAR
jgi:hypothetical protein